MYRWCTETSRLTRREVDRVQTHYVNEIYIFFLSVIFSSIFQGFLSQHNFYSSMKLHFYHNVFDLTAATLAPDLTIFIDKYAYTFVLNVSSSESRLVLIQSVV